MSQHSFGYRYYLLSVLESGCQVYMNLFSQIALDSSWLTSFAI